MRLELNNQLFDQYMGPKQVLPFQVRENWGLMRRLLKNNILIIRKDINDQMGKNVNNKFSLHNTSNRNGKHLMDFILENKLTCPNTKFQITITLS